jgi:hypothetical protein
VPRRPTDPPPASDGLYGLPGAFPGASYTVPAFVPCYPAPGPTEGAFLYAQIAAIANSANAALPLAGGTLNGTLTIAAEPSPQIIFPGRFSITTDNLGDIGHTSSGPNLNIICAETGFTGLILRQLGELALYIHHPQLTDNSIQHNIQLHRQSNVAGALGIGTGVQIFISDASGQAQEAGNLQCYLSNVTTGAVDSVIQFLTKRGGVGITNMLLIGATGETRLSASPGGFLTATNFSPATINGQVTVGDHLPDGSSQQFAGNAAGTGYAANFASGFTGNLIDLQIAGVSRFVVGATGQVTIPGTLVAAPSGTVTIPVNLNVGNGMTLFGALVAPSGSMFQFGQRVITPGADTDYTMSATDLPNVRIQFNPGPWTTSRNVIFPAGVVGFVIWFNNTSFSTTLLVSGGSGFTVAPGKTCIAWLEGGTIIRRCTPDA